MARNPARDAHTDRPYLVGANPRAREPRDARALDAEIAGRADHDVLEIAHVLVHVASIRMEIEDGIADHLPGTVIGDIAAAARLVHLDVPRGEQLGRGNQVRSRRIRLDAERNDMRMLEQEKDVGHTPGPPLFDERALHLAGHGVGNDAEPPDFQVTHTYMVACRAVAQSAKAG